MPLFVVTIPFGTNILNMLFVKINRIVSLCNFSLWLVQVYTHVCAPLNLIVELVVMVTVIRMVLTTFYSYLVFLQENVIINETCC